MSTPQVEIGSIDLQKGPRLAPMDPTSLQCVSHGLQICLWSGIDAFPGINVPPLQFLGKKWINKAPSIDMRK